MYYVLCIVYGINLLNLQKLLSSIASSVKKQGNKRGRFFVSETVLVICTQTPCLPDILDVKVTILTNSIMYKWKYKMYQYC